MRKLISAALLVAALFVLARPASATHSAWDIYDDAVTFYVETWSGLVCSSPTLGFICPATTLWYAPGSSDLRNRPADHGIGWVSRGRHPAYQWHFWVHGGEIHTGMTVGQLYDVYAFIDYTATQNPTRGCWYVQIHRDDLTVESITLGDVGNRVYREEDVVPFPTGGTANEAIIITSLETNFPAGSTSCPTLSSTANLLTSPPENPIRAVSIGYATRLGTPAAECPPNTRDPGTWALDCPSVAL